MLLSYFATSTRIKKVVLSLPPSVLNETQGQRDERDEKKRKTKKSWERKKRNEVSAANCTFLFLPSSSPVSTKLFKFLYFYSFLLMLKVVSFVEDYCVIVNAWFFLSIC